MYKDADGRLYTREELDAAPGNLLTEYIPPSKAELRRRCRSGVTIEPITGSCAEGDHETCPVAFDDGADCTCRCHQAANDLRGIVNRVRAFCTHPDPRGGIEGFRHVDDILAIIGDERYDDQGHAGNGPE